MRKVILLLISIFVVLVMWTARLQAGEKEIVTLDIGATNDQPTTLDPQMAEEGTSIALSENVFLQLLNYDEDKQRFEPEAAESWYVEEDGKYYYFQLRNDIPWVHKDPVTGEITQVVDENGSPRFVTAQDFVNGIRRTCDPRLGEHWPIYLIAPSIKGCQEALEYPDPEDIPPELLQAIGVQAVSDDLLKIEMEEANGYFPSMASMWVLSAVPQWVIDTYGEGWTDPDVIVTNGRYVLDEWEQDIRMQLKQNPLLPSDLHGRGNSDQIVLHYASSSDELYTMWQNNEIDLTEIPDDRLEAHLSDYPHETEQYQDQAVLYLGFRTTKPPFDDMRVRRAFSAAIDRKELTEEVLGNAGQPMKHFAPPGVFGSPQIEAVGVGTNISFARSQLADAGYPDCVGFPSIQVMGYDKQSVRNWLDFSVNQWHENLGCDPALFQVEIVSFQELLQRTSKFASDEDAPHIWPLGWLPDYLDENNWVGDVLECDSHENRQKRSCSEVDTLIKEAGREVDQEKRTSFYRDIEDMFFGKKGEMPIAPMYVRERYFAQHRWLSVEFRPFWAQRWYDWRINAAQNSKATR